MTTNKIVLSFLAAILAVAPVRLPAAEGEVRVAPKPASAADVVLDELDAFLSIENMSRLVPAKQLDVVYNLAQREDMSCLDKDLVSDEMLLLLDKRGIMKTRFGALVEQLQAIANGMKPEERAALMSKWRGLWLEKASRYVRHVKSLRRRWTLFFSNTVDWDSNVLLRDANAPEASTGDDDWGMTNTFRPTLRPWVDSRGLKDWSIETSPSIERRDMTDVKVVQYETLGLSQLIAHDSPKHFVTRSALSLGYERSYSQDPANERMQYEQRSVTGELSLWPVKFAQSWFTSSSCRAALSWRGKTDFRDASLAASTAGSKEQDTGTWTLSFGQTLLHSAQRGGQTLGWNVDYETAKTSPATEKDYRHVNLGLSHSRSFALAAFRNPLNWRNTASWRAKNWGNPARTGDMDDESQFSLSTSLRATWTANWSSRLSLSYMRKDQEILVQGSKEINQFRLALNTIFMTF